MSWCGGADPIEKINRVNECVKQQTEYYRMPEVVEDALKDIPGLQELSRRHEVMVCNRNYSEKHIVKTMEKEPLYVCKWETHKKFFSSKPPIHVLTVKNLEKAELLIMVRNVDCVGVGVWSPKELLLTAVPGIPVGRITSSEENIFNVREQNDNLVYVVEMVERMNLECKNYMIKKPDGTKIGSIGDNKGAKHRLVMPSDMPLRHKALLLGLALSIQNVYDEDQDNRI